MASGIGTFQLGARFEQWPGAGRTQLCSPPYSGSPRTSSLSIVRPQRERSVGTKQRPENTQSLAKAWSYLFSRLLALPVDFAAPLEPTDFAAPLEPTDFAAPLEPTFVLPLPASTAAPKCDSKKSDPGTKPCSRRDVQKELGSAGPCK